jgi:hypothetical protein
MARSLRTAGLSTSVGSGCFEVVVDRWCYLEGFSARRQRLESRLDRCAHVSADAVPRLGYAYVNRAEITPGAKL